MTFPRSLRDRSPAPVASLLVLLALLAWSTPAIAEDLASMDLEDLMDVEVTTVSKQARKLGDSPAAVTVISAEDIRRSGAKSVPEVLRGVPGLHVAQIDATHWSVSSRGFSDEFSNKLLVMVDGRSIYAPIFSGVLWNEHDLMLEDIERIEVVRGPGGTLWGANAVNGVINIMTKQASDTQGLLAASNTGTYEKFGATTRYGHEFTDSAHMRVYGKFADRDDFRSPVSGSADDDWESLRTGARFDWAITEDDFVTLQGDYYDGEADRAVVAGLASEENNEGANVLLRYGHAFSPTSELSIQGYWDRTERTQDIFITEERDTFDVELQHTFQPLARNLVVWGAGYRASEDDIEGSFALDFSNSSRKDDLISFFVQDELSIVPDLLTLTLGSKLEHNDYTGLELQPSGRILLTPGEHNMFWGAVSRAVRTPSRVEDDVAYIAPSGPTSFQAVSGSHDVDSEDLIAYELGFRSTPHPRVNLDVAGFYNDYEHLISSETLATVPGPIFGTTLDIIQLDNELSGASYGFELASAFRVTDIWSLTGTYTFTRMELDPSSQSTVTDEETIENRTPRHQIGLRSQLDLPRDFSFDTALFWVDRLKGLDVDAYTRLDLRLAWQALPGLEVSVVGLNLIEEHTEFPNGLLTQASKVPRSVYGNVRWEFQ